jgi:twin arginine-targeting protein translocase TatB
VFNIGPLELVVLAIVGIVVLGPDKLPGYARDAARMLRTLRELATGARQQLREELGPEFADLDLRNLDPRTAVQRAVFGDDVPDLRKYNPRTALRDAIFGEDEPAAPVSMTKDVDLTKDVTPPASANGHGSPNGTRPRPRPRPTPRTKYDDDAT